MTTTAPTSMSALLAPGQRLLRTSLRLDAVVTGVNGLAYLALSGPLESLLGLDTEIGIPIGIFLTVYGIAVALVSMPKTIDTKVAGVIATSNVAWVVVSLAALLGGGLDLNVVGSIWTVAQAAAVGGFAALQYLGIRRAR
ncbi:hypothetical protein [Nocardia australiensis]|uniref:hypothetical protein n=1 Tax=Nocardia australiensis TaxID=2887191 RepID=UPI001D14DE4E|nr:hypothetical protein [Nocardia australiensis]